MSTCARPIPAWPAVLAVACFCSSGVRAQPVTPPGAELSPSAAKRFPQPVRVGDLLHRTVLEPVESRRILGHIERLIRLDGGKDAIVMTYGGLWGIGGHRIAVPLEAMALLGREVEVLDFTPQQLDGFPTYDGSGRAFGADEIVHMGLAHPSH